jgi:gamma-D-glutamyl-L-lysine dipeptidyl-peptidase
VSDRLLRVERLLESVRDRYAPDRRTSVFEIRCHLDGDALTLAGATSELEAAEVLHHEAALLDGWAEIRDRIVRLPNLGEDEPRHAVVTAAAAPLLAGPAVTATHVSQVVLGRRLDILRRRGRWYHCRAEDGYLGWVYRGYVLPLTEPEARAWEVGAGGEVCVSLGASVHAGDGEWVARLPWGARVVREPDGGVRLPDGRRGAAHGDLIHLTERPRSHPADPDAIVATSLEWLGAPYLWGGVTPGGVDCSGLVQSVYGLHGIELPRDSDQQARAGSHLEPGSRFENVRPADLLFFAEATGSITHVVISAGGGRIVHASLGNGGVTRNDLNGPLAFEEELRRIFVCARRFL